VFEPIILFFERLFRNKDLLYVESLTVTLESIPVAYWMALGTQLLLTFAPLFFIINLDGLFQSKTDSQSPSSTRNCLYLLTPLVLLGLWIRSCRFTQTFPPGLEQDEYVWAYDYMRIVAGIDPPFGAGTFGIPLLQGSISSLFFMIWGISPTTIRLWSLITGSLLPIPFFFLIRWSLGTRAAFFATFFLILSPYAVFYSRVISGGRLLFNATTTTALTLATTRLITESGTSEFNSNIRGKLVAYIAALVSGILLAFTINDYFSSRVLPIAIIISLLYWVFKSKNGTLKGRITTSTIIVVLFIFSLLPFISTSYEHTFSRIQQESLLSSFLKIDWPVIYHQVRQTSLMFFTPMVEGRSTWFSTPEIIVLQPLLAGLFILGCFLLVVNRKHPEFILFLIIGIVPTLLSTDPPDSHRALLSLLPSLAIAAYGFSWTSYKLRFIYISIPLFFGIFIHGACTLHYFYFHPTFLQEQFHTNWLNRIKAVEKGIPTFKLEKIGINGKFTDLELNSPLDLFFGMRMFFQGIQFSRFHWTVLDTPEFKNNKIFHLYLSSTWIRDYFAKHFTESSLVTVNLHEKKELYIFVKSGNRQNTPFPKADIQVRLLKNNTLAYPPFNVHFPAALSLTDFISDNKSWEEAREDFLKEVDTIEWKIVAINNADIPKRFLLKHGIFEIVQPEKNEATIVGKSLNTPIAVHAPMAENGTTYRLSALKKNTSLLPLHPKKHK
jgi:hypothetical protein